MQSAGGLAEGNLPNGALCVYLPLSVRQPLMQYATPITHHLFCIHRTGPEA